MLARIVDWIHDTVVAFLDWLHGWLDPAWQWLSRHLFTVIAVVAGTYVVVFVEQVGNLVTRQPDDFHLSDFRVGWELNVFEEGKWWLWSAFVVILYLLLRLSLHPGMLPGDRDEGEHESVQRYYELLRERKPVVQSSWFYQLGHIIVRAATYFVHRANSSTAQTNRWIGLLTVLFGVVWIALPLPNDWPYLLERPLRVAFGFLLIALGIWFMLVPRYLVGDPPRMGLRMNVFGRLVTILLMANLFGECLWLLVNETSWVTFQSYTIWALFHLWFCLLAVALYCDICQYAAPGRWNVRAVIVGAAVVHAAIFLYPVSVGVDGHDGPPTDAAVITNRWFDRLQARIDAVPGDGPLVFVAASGGGSRAAVFTALILEGLSQLPIEPKGDAKHTVADHIVLISAVSGGSLGTAYYVHEAYDPASGRPKPLRRQEDMQQSESRELTRRMMRISGAIAEKEDLPAPLKDAFREVSAECEVLYNKQATELKTAPWLFQSVYVDDMCTDFMGPLLRGALMPFVERGSAMSQFWEKRFDWIAVNNHDGFPDKAPVVLFNACDVEQGTRVAISFPRLPPGLLPLAGPEKSRYRPRALTDYDTAYRLQLAEAVRLSANFPYGLEVGQLNSKHEKPLLVMDGGITDNTGIDTIVYLMERLAGIADLRQNAGTLEGRAYKLMQSIQKRGVILVEIDSGAKQTDPPSAAFLFRTLSRPMQALNNSNYANSEISRRDRINALLRILNAPLESATATDPDTADQPRGYNERILSLPVTFTCNHADSVMTAWALGADDKAKIIVQFLVDWKDSSEKFHYAYEKIAQSTRLQRELAKIEAGTEQARRLSEESEQLNAELRELPEKLMLHSLAKKQEYVQAYQGENEPERPTEPVELLNKPQLEMLHEFRQMDRFQQTAK